MTESDTSASEPNLAPGDSLPEMSFWQKVDFIGPSLTWTVLLFLWILLGLLTLVASTLFFVLYLMHRVRGISYSDFLAGPLIIAISVAGLRISLPRLLQARRRRRATGSHFPRGEELIAWRTAKQRPNVWKRIVVVAFLVWNASPWAAALFKAEYRHMPSIWAAAVLLWAAVILTGFASFPLRKEPGWLSPALAAVFAAVGMISVHLALSPQFPSGFWEYSALALAISAVGGIDAFRSRSHRPKTPLPTE